MIKISKPYLREEGDCCKVQADISGLPNHREFTLWYSVDSSIGKYLCYELSDAFLVALIPIAAKTQIDIACDGVVSSRLLFNINNNITFLFSKIFENDRVIRVVAKTDIEEIQKGEAVATGCSLGVDSMASIWRHYQGNVQHGYKLTHLALFNCGQMGDSDHHAALSYFNEAAERSAAFAQELGLPLVRIESNINELYDGAEVGILASVNMRTISCAMALQKLFGKYIFASTYNFTHMSVHEYDEEYMEGFIVPNLSTNLMEVILSCADMTRVEKESYIDQFPLTHKYLNVCCAEQMAYTSGGDAKRWMVGKEKLNCGWCDKCMRTLLAYDALGKLDDYADIFDLEKYNAHKALYIRHTFVNDAVKPFAGELANLMLAKKYKLPCWILWQYQIKLGARRLNVKFQETVFKIVRRLNRGFDKY